MDHSAGSYVYDPAGRLRVYHRYGSGAQALAADVATLLKEAEVSCSAHWGRPI